MRSQQYDKLVHKLLIIINIIITTAILLSCMYAVLGYI